MKRKRRDMMSLQRHFLKQLPTNLAQIFREHVRSMYAQKDIASFPPPKTGEKLVGADSAPPPHRRVAGLCSPGTLLRKLCIT